MSRAKKRRGKKQRRAIKKRLKHGKTAVPKHKLLSGRTGRVHSKKRKSGRV